MRLLLAAFFILTSVTAHGLDRCEDAFWQDSKADKAIQAWTSEIALASDEGYNVSLESDQDAFLLQIHGGSTRIGKIAAAMARNYGVKLFLDRNLPFGHGLVTFDGNVRLSYMALASPDLHLPVLIHEAVHMKLQSRVLKREIDLPLAVLFSGDNVFKKKGYQNFFRADEALAYLKGSRVAKRMKKQMPRLSIERFILWTDQRDQRKASKYFTQESLRLIDRALADFDQIKDTFEYSRNAIAIVLDRAGRSGRPVYVAVPFDLSKVDESFMETNKALFLSVIQAQLEITRAALLKIEADHQR